jgi:hypothetical protein
MILKSETVQIKMSKMRLCFDRNEINLAVAETVSSQELNIPSNAEEAERAVLKTLRRNSNDRMAVSSRKNSIPHEKRKTRSASRLSVKIGECWRGIRRRRRTANCASMRGWNVLIWTKEVIIEPATAARISRIHQM